MAASMIESALSSPRARFAFAEVSLERAASGTRALFASTERGRAQPSAKDTAMRMARERECMALNVCNRGRHGVENHGSQGASEVSDTALCLPALPARPHSDERGRPGLGERRMKLVQLLDHALPAVARRCLAAALAIALLAFSSQAGAQAPTGVVRGRVTDAAGGRGLVAAQVSVNGTRIGTVTGAEGEFVLTAVPT